MITFNSVETIDRPIDGVRRFLTRIDRYGEWMPVENVRMLSGEPDKPGSVLGMLMAAPGGRRYDMQFEVAEATDRGFAWRVLRGGPLRGEYRVDLEAVGTRTRATYSGRLQLTGLWRLLTPIVAREVAAGESNELRQMKALVEAGA